MRKINVCQEKNNLVFAAQLTRSLSPGLYVRLGKGGRDLQTTVSRNDCFQIFSFGFGNYFYTHCRLTSSLCLFEPPPKDITVPLYPTHLLLIC